MNRVLKAGASLIATTALAVSLAGTSIPAQAEPVITTPAVATTTATVVTATASTASASTVKATAVKKKKKKSRGLVALAYAKKQLGDRYRYGAAGPNSWDCSGLTMKSWAHAGKKLPHSARGQFHRGKHVARSNLQKGDLVFFYSGIRHVAIYAGNGKVIHASRPGHPVAYIKIKYMPYKGARRV